MSAEEQAGFKDHFSAAAAGYAQHRPTYPMQLVDFLADLVPQADTAWDSGCGSGQLSVLLAERFAHVVATDASQEQIAHATPHARVEYRCARAEASELPDQSIDLAVAAQAAHWFDLDAYYGEVRRVARQGAVIALVTYGILLVDATLDPLIGHFYEHVVGPYWPFERRHVEDGYRSLPFPFLELAAPELEIDVAWNLAELLGYFETWSAVRVFERRHGRTEIEAFRQQLSALWGDPAERRPVRWPLAVRVGKVQ